MLVVVDVKSWVVGVTAGVVSVVAVLVDVSVVLLPDPDVSELVPALLVSVVVGVGEATKAMPLELPPADRVLSLMLALPSPTAAPLLPNRPVVTSVAEPLEPAMTENVSVPLLDCSQGGLPAGAPPSRLAPMT